MEEKMFYDFNTYIISQLILLVVSYETKSIIYDLCKSNHF